MGQPRQQMARQLESGGQIASRDVEGDLLRRIAGKDRAAFELLYRGYYRRLGRFLEKMTRRPQLVDEIINETMFAVWQNAASFAGASRVSTWIFGIGYRQAVKALAREQRHVESTAPADEAMTEFQEGPEGELIRHQSRKMLARLLGELSAEQRAVVELTYYYGYAYKEIAAIVDCPVDTVKTRMFHARRKLRLLIEAGGPEGRP